MIDAPQQGLAVEPGRGRRNCRWIAWCSLAVPVLVAAAVGGGLLWRPWRRSGRPARRVQPEVHAPVPDDLPRVRFTDVTEDSGITFELENGACGDKLLPETMCGGCAFFDFDNDGDQDVLLVNSRRWEWDSRAAASPTVTGLFRNDGRGRYSDVSAGSGLDVECTGQGVAVGDYDNDGWVDVFISAVGNDYLFHNEAGRFRDVSAEAGVAGSEDSYGASCGFFDYDNDGWLDLFVCNYVVWSVEIDKRLECTNKQGQRGYCGPGRYQGTFCCLYHNDGGGRFSDVSAAVGVQLREPTTGEGAAKALGVVFWDVNADGFADVIVANDKVPNFLFINQRDGSFQECAAAAGIAVGREGRAYAGMGVDAAHFRNNGMLGLTIANFSDEPSTLYVSDGLHPVFEDCTDTSGLGPASRRPVKFGTYFFDYDLDGRLDILLASGQIQDLAPRSTEQPNAEPPRLYYNCGGDAPHEFVTVPESHCGEDFCRPIVGRGAAYADIDGDGDLDVLITARRGRPRLLRNDQALGRNWLRVKLVGTRCNRDAIGSWVEAHAGGVVQRRFVSPTRSYYSQVELPVTFGLGGAETVERLVVRWADGLVEEFPSVPAGRLLVLTQPGQAPDRRP